jgi:hypothetical protein
MVQLQYAHGFKRAQYMLMPSQVNRPRKVKAPFYGAFLWLLARPEKH